MEKYGIEWLDTYQQRQRRQSTDVRQRTSRQRSTLDWADVEAWVKRQEHTSENWAVGGYYTDCPVSTHKTDDLISVWAGDNGSIGLKCWGGCKYPAIHEALADAIKTGAPSVTEPPAAVDARIKELEESLAAANDRASQSDRERAALENSNGEMQDELETLRDDKDNLANNLDTKVEEFDALQEEKSKLENSLSTAKDRRDQLRRERDSAKRKLSRREQKISDLQNDVEKLQEEKSSLETNLAAASKATQDDANNDPERTALENHIRNLQAGNSSLAKNLAALKAELERESAAREELADEKADLTKQLTATKAELGPTRAARIAAENYARTLQTENSSLKDRLATASNVRQDVRAPNTLQENGPLAGAWGLFRKDEPTYAFIDAMSVLELNLRRALERKTVLADDGLQHMLMAACEQHIALISEEQRRRLDEMRRNRNRVLHHRHQLKISEARDALDYLKSTIGHLAPSRSSIRALGGVIG